MKIIKAFKLFLKADDENLKKLQDEASAIMNEDKIVGTFCISIHPLDYISISDNWHTCHSMDSDYRVGNLNYMADRHTVVCYVKSGENRKIENFPDNIPWNSKKWRVLLFFDSKGLFVMAGKQYPLQSEEALNFFQKAWRQMNHIYYFSPWNTKQLSSMELDEERIFTFPSPLIPIGSQMVPVEQIYRPGPNTQQYNDILKNSDFRKQVPYAFLQRFTSQREKKGLHIGDTYTCNELFNDKRLPYIEAGEEINCPCCGIEPVSASDSILCDHCTFEYIKHNILDEDYFPICARCGKQFIYYEGRWTSEGQLCGKCAANIEEDE